MPPRLVIAGLSGESGKTLISLGLILAASRAGVAVRGFKKGPDYIDAAWLSWASGHPARNLDTYLMGFEQAVQSFVQHALPEGLNVIEGNRGLYDGVDAEGTHSTAALAKALQAPVVLVVNATKVTRTVAACVLGCRKLDPEVPLAGVILNRVGSLRQEQIIREAVVNDGGLPVLGVVRRAAFERLLPQRYLGLVTPDEHGTSAELRANLISLAQDELDVERLFSLARQAPQMVATIPAVPKAAEGHGLRIGYLRDSAFTFYYPENIEALESAGAQLVPVPAVTASQLPSELDALYIGGGFPETHAASLAANRTFLESLRDAATQGLPIYAECGGLMLLARTISWKGRSFPMAGVLPFDVEVCSEPQGHGYAHLLVDGPNPFFAVGTTLRGHEFHYSRILLEGAPPPTASSVVRGTGCFARRDGVIAWNVVASYVHLHATATPEWAQGLLAAARRRSRKGCA